MDSSFDHTVNSNEIEDRLPRSGRMPRNRRSNKKLNKPSNDNGNDNSDDFDPNLGSLLMDLPHDILLHVLTYLDPASLICLSSVNKELLEIVADDSTWRRSYAFAFLGISPGEGSRVQSIIMPRLGGKFSTWKEEYVRRCMLMKRWKKSKAPVISHNPRVATIHSIAIDLSTLTDPNLTPRRLITASLVHGCVTRSEPFSGKLAKGYILAPGMAPNDATVLKLSSEGRIIWGFAGGFVGFTVIAKSALQHGSGAASAWGLRGSGLVTHNNISDDFHAGPVSAIAHPNNTSSKYSWASQTFVSGSVDGTIKLWANEPILHCFWTSPMAYYPTKQTENQRTRADSVTSIDYDSISNSISAGYESGSIRVWSNLQIEAYLSERKPIEISKPNYSKIIDDWQYQKPVDKIIIDSQNTVNMNTTSQQNSVSLLIHRKSYNHFERHDIDLNIIKKFGCGPLTDLTSFYLNGDISKCSPFSTPILSRTQSSANNLNQSTALDISSFFHVKDQILKHRRAIVAGDATGRTCIWDWDDKSFDEYIKPLKLFDGHQSKITSIALTPLLLITGSADGLLLAHDPLTGEYIRSFNQNSSQRHLSNYLSSNQASIEDESAFAVSDIVADEFAIVASIGNKILSWKAGDVKDFKTRGKGWRGPHKPSSQKYQYSSDIRDEIRESLEIENEENGESDGENVINEKMLSRLENLGLNETETLEYIMMISKEEEAKKKELEQSDDLESMLEEIRRAEQFESMPKPIEKEIEQPDDIESILEEIQRAEEVHEKGKGKEVANKQAVEQSDDLESMLEEIRRAESQSMPEQGSSSMPFNEINMGNSTFNDSYENEENGQKLSKKAGKKSEYAPNIDNNEDNKPNEQERLSSNDNGNVNNNNNINYNSNDNDGLPTYEQDQEASFDEQMKLAMELSLKDS